MRVDGRAIASLVLQDVCKRVSMLGRTPVVRAITLQPSVATLSYLKIKTKRAKEACMDLDVVRLSDDATEVDVIDAIGRPGADAVIIQLPIPHEVYATGVLDRIAISLDADVLSMAAYKQFENNEPGALVPPVAAAVLEVIVRSGFDVHGKKTVVVGKGQLVGKPVALALARLGASVTTVSKETVDKESLYKDADLIVSGAGVAHVITPDMVKDGVALIDAGTSGFGGGVAGDIHPDCEAKASLFTPVPGGIGPIAVACLFRNTAELLTRVQKV